MGPVLQGVRGIRISRVPVLQLVFTDFLPAVRANPLPPPEFLSGKEALAVESGSDTNTGLRCPVGVAVGVPIAGGPLAPLPPALCGRPAPSTLDTAGKGRTAKGQFPPPPSLDSLVSRISPISRISAHCFF